MPFKRNYFAFIKQVMGVQAGIDDLLYRIAHQVQSQRHPQEHKSWWNQVPPSFVRDCSSKEGSVQHASPTHKNWVSQAEETKTSLRELQKICLT